MTSYSETELKAIRDQHEPWLRAQQGVVGTGIGLDKSGRISLKVYSNQMPAETRNAIVERLSPAPVAIEETGEIHKQTART
jgi:hypothetical protein